MQRESPKASHSDPSQASLQCIKCTHGGLSMPAAGLTLKMRESKAWDRVKCWFGIRPTWPKGRKQTGYRPQSPVQVEGSCRWARERARGRLNRRQIELPRHWFSQMSKQIFVAIFRTFRIWLTHWLAGHGRQAGPSRHPEPYSLWSASAHLHCMPHAE